MIPALLLLCQFAEPPRPAPPVPTPPAAAVVLPPDRNAGRPKVVVYSSPNCPACTRFAGWLAANAETSFFAFEYKPTPAWVQSVPAFHWQNNVGEWKVSYGWAGIDAFRRAWESGQAAAETVASRQTAAAERLPDTLRRFAGESGTIVFRPDRKTKATVTDGVTLDVGEITARYDLRGEPKITFTEPQPRGTVEKFGFGIGFVLQSATYQAPDTVRVGTNWKTITVRINDD